MGYKITYINKYKKRKIVEIESNSILAAIGLIYELNDFALIINVKLIN